MRWPDAGNENARARAGAAGVQVVWLADPACQLAVQQAQLMQAAEQAFAATIDQRLAGLGAPPISALSLSTP